jgi:protein-arginine kinase
MLACQVFLVKRESEESVPLDLVDHLVIQALMGFQVSVAAHMHL